MGLEFPKTRTGNKIDWNRDGGWVAAVNKEDFVAEASEPHREAESEAGRIALSREMQALAAAMSLVHAGGRSIDEVETLASERGIRSLFRAPYDFERSVASAAHWPIPFAAAWILTRDRDQALAQWVRYKIWGRALWRGSNLNLGGKQWHVATDELWHALRSGAVTAFGSRDTSGAPSPIGAVEWHGLTWERYGQVDLISRHRDHRAAYHDVLVDAAKVTRLWPAASAADHRLQATALSEKQCQAALEQMMRERPSDPVPKAQLKPKFPSVSAHGFDRAYRAAVEATGATAWRKAGRRRKSPRP